MQPTATEIERKPSGRFSPGAPAETIGSLDQQCRQPRPGKPSRGSDAGGAAAHDYDIKVHVHQ
jgi:hypothetical protein